ncbi:cytochrome c oxidase assembly protein [Streptomyces sp. Go40/10]|uniref:cytochrome c oxidase assembly protein n=1 Tax=Streptomyces sp. Go40/10 TaxID=2825844 RepID=UPI001E4992E4|nr:cytochrome c oxidase assembly protein [Streptomyces sp. Go40/10]UFR00782.1 cytochrome c oxidase assembly protein [Streptomyces sp. Go40/10]
MGHHMPHAHHQEGGGTLGVLLPALALLVCAGGYLLLARRASRRNPARVWNPWRTVGFGAGVVLLAVALLPPLAPFAHRDFRGHMTQHLLIGMYAPLALVLGAPATLLLRVLPAPRARRLTALLHSGPARLLTHPAVALLLSAGTLPVVYFTPLYGTVTAHPAGHWLLHAHFLLSGCLFAHSVAGPDPAPARPGVRARLVCLGCAIAVHAVVAQLMYGGFWVDVQAPVPQVQGGAEIMYYGGDLAELLLAAALVATWRPERHRIGKPSPGRVRKPSPASLYGTSATAPE